MYGAGANNVITVQNSQVVDEELRTIPGTATIVDGQSGVLQVTLTTSSGRKLFDFYDNRLSMNNLTINKMAITKPLVYSYSKLQRHNRYSTYLTPTMTTMLFCTAAET